jgi:hypothetical protein
VCPSEADLNYVKSERPLIPEEGRQAPAAGHRLCSPVGYHLDLLLSYCWPFPYVLTQINLALTETSVKL